VRVGKRNDRRSRASVVLPANRLSSSPEGHFIWHVNRVQLVKLLKLPLHPTPDTLEDGGVDLLPLLSHGASGLGRSVLPDGFSHVNVSCTSHSTGIVDD